jgi:hypothetical protein
MSVLEADVLEHQTSDYEGTLVPNLVQMTPKDTYVVKRSQRKRRFDTIGDDESRRECTSE